MYAKDFYKEFKGEFLYLKDENEILPDPLTCEVQGTMEHDTIVRRIPEDILGRVLRAEKTFCPTSGRGQQLKTLEELFKNGEKENFKKLDLNDEQEDKRYWDYFVEYFNKKKLTVVECPWLFSELYFYRYLSLVYTIKNKNVDPYAESKCVALVKNIDFIEEVCACAHRLIESAQNQKGTPDKQIISIFCFMSLWFNQYDLSWQSQASRNQEELRNVCLVVNREDETEKHTVKRETEIEMDTDEANTQTDTDTDTVTELGKEEKKKKNGNNKGENSNNNQTNIMEGKTDGGENAVDIKKKTLEKKKLSFQSEDINMIYKGLYVDKIICNDIDELCELLPKNGKKERLDIVLDNAGMELIADLCFLNFMSTYFKQIVMHVKKFPLFVSDVMVGDIEEALECLKNSKNKPNAQKLGSTCKSYIDSKQWVIKEDVYWNLPIPFWVPKKTIYEEFCKSNLVCIKGDANYRRSLGDLKFDFSFPHREALSYFPCPVVLLRCLKSPLACGIDKTIVDKLNSKGRHWSNYGEYALLQFFSKKK